MTKKQTDASPLTKNQIALLERVKAAGGTLDVYRPKQIHGIANEVAPGVWRTLQRRGLLRATRAGLGKFRLVLVAVAALAASACAVEPEPSGADAGAALEVSTCRVEIRATAFRADGSRANGCLLAMNRGEAYPTDAAACEPGAELGDGVYRAEVPAGEPFRYSFFGRWGGAGDGYLATVGAHWYVLDVGPNCEGALGFASVPLPW